MSSWLSLPLTKPNPTKLPDEVSSSDPDWLLNRNFKDRLHFKPWSSFEDKVKGIRRDLSQLPKTSEARKEIQDLLKPVRKDLVDQGWHGCWNESAVERQVAVQVWRAVNQARLAVLTLRKQQDSYRAVYFVPQNQVRSEHYVQRVCQDLGREVKIANPEHIIPDFCCFSKASDSRDNKSPLATVELKGSQAKLVYQGKNGSSPKRVAEYFQWVFAKKPIKSVLGDHFHVAKRLSQALTQAFHTESGSGALYNHVYALFFYIEGKKVLGDGRVRVVVRISRVYRCDRSPSNIHAFTAWTSLLEELASLRDENTRKQKLLEAIEFVSTSSKEHEDDDDCPPSSSSEEPASPPGTPSSATSSPSRKRQKQNSSQKKDSSSKSKKRPFDIANVSSHPPLSQAAGLSQKRLESFEAFVIESGIEEAKIQIESFRNDALIRRALDSKLEILGEGMFGIVRRALLNDVEVAVKYRKRCVGASLQYLYNEMVMYCLIASRFPHLLNYAVPGIVAFGFDEWLGPVLITKVVGEYVYVSDGCLIVGDKHLHQKSSTMVGEAALTCLKALHGCGILHRDVTFKNLRAHIPDAEIQHDTDDPKVDQCVTWWIDLGLSKLGGSQDEFDFELEQCLSLFTEFHIEL